MRATLNALSALLLFLSTAVAGASAQGSPIGFEESFALAGDRGRALEELIPGTPEYYFYACLHAQNEGRLDEAEELLSVWRERHGRQSALDQLELRQALLSYRVAPERTFAFLIRNLGLRFDHRRSAGNVATELSTHLDPRSIAYATLVQRALARGDDAIDELEDRALAAFAARTLSEAQLKELLSRLERPDVPGLPALVVRELAAKRSRGFGALGIHGRLLTEQLDECARLRPELLENAPFVTTYLQRLAPGADDDLADPDTREAYLARLERFVARLAPAFDSLRAHTLYHRLEHDLGRGQPDRERFLAYLRLPRNTSYGDPEYLRGKVAVDLGRVKSTGFPPVRDDEPLVRAYLAHFFGEGASPEPFIGPLRREYVERILAETRILAGQGDMERWYSLLDDPAYYEALKERVDLEFPVTQRRDFAVDEPVRLELDVKNVDTLLVKVFELDTLGFFESQGSGRMRDIDASIDLDGLVASREETFTYDAPPLRRVRRSFAFEGLDHPGVWILDFIGGGRSSRAVIRKGGLSYLERRGAAGHVLQVLDESGALVPDATIHCAGRRYVADERGELTLPYTNDPGRRQLVLRRGEFAVLDELEHAAETYRLEAGLHVERESLLAGETALLTVRPRLSVADAPAALALLQDVTLEVVATDLDGVATSQTVRDLALEEGRAFLHELQVPARTAELRVTLHARVESLSAGTEVELAAGSAAFPINGIDAGTDLVAGLLTRTPDGYALDVRGKNGEPVTGRVLSLRLQHEDFRRPVDLQLQSDASGRVHLGPLAGIVRLRVRGLGDAPESWDLRPRLRAGAPRALAGVEGGTLRVPFEGTAANLSRADASLLELRRGAPARDRFGKLALAGGFLELRGLEAGDYELRLHETEERLPVRITRGPRRAGWALGARRRLELSDPRPLQILSAGVEADALVVRLANAGPAARLFVSATRYLPGFDPHTDLALEPLRGLRSEPSARFASLLASGRTISDEYRYILERRLARTYPGNMLARPGLLLNPWAVDESTDSMVGMGGGAGGSFGGRSGGKNAGSAPARSGRPDEAGASPATYANLDFLPGPARVFANLAADANGVVRIPLAALGANHVVRVVATEGGVTLSRTVVRPETVLSPRDRRLANGLDPARHMVEQRRIEYVPAEASVPLGDLAHSGVRTLDTLASVFQLYTTLSGDEDLGRFEFLVSWPSLSDEEQRARYSEFACHEVNVFLHEKDRPFFDEVVRPYLANKGAKTFLDHWLLDADLSGYLEPWAFARLNVVERILLLRGLDGGAARHVRELVELLPPDAFALGTYFAGVLVSGGLDAQDELGVELRERMKDARARAELGFPARPRAGPTSPGGAEVSTGSEGFFLGRDARKAKDDELADAPMEEPELESLGYSGEPAFDTDLDFSRREQMRQLFRDLPDTQELAESDYWHVPRGRANAERIEPTPFWLDFAEAAPGTPFVSPRFALATRNLSEMLLALAFLDLPFEAGDHRLEEPGGRTTLVAGSGLFLARKELAEATVPEAAPPILVGQDLFRQDDPFVVEDGRRRDRFVTDEFLRRVVYVCRVVVTNPGSAPLDVDVLLQVPEGSLPAMSGRETRGVELTLEAYGSRSLEYAFYFPEAGTFRHYPVHVGMDGALLGFAPGRDLRVVEQPSSVDTTSWEHVSQLADTDAVLAYLRQANLRSIDLSRIAWRMQDRATFARVTALLRARHVFEPTLWSYALQHRDGATAREYLERRDDLVRRCGPVLSSPLLSIEPVERGFYEHLEYEPLVHARAHRFGARYRLLDRDLAEQYTSFLRVLAYRPVLRDEERLEAVYYLALQDRVTEALELFATVQPATLATRLQYDYMRAYLDFYAGELDDARRVAAAYRDHPVTRWRARFRDVLSQLEEAAGRTGDGTEQGGRDQEQGALAAGEPALELEVEARRVKLTYANVERCSVSYREMDIELLFSTSPFLQAGSSAFACVKPNRTDVLELGRAEGVREVDLPAEFQSSNVLVEVRAGGLVRRQAYYANDLAVQRIENYGQLRVREASSGKLLPGVYVKVYARLVDGRTRFHKDGYTDLRGRFDYVSVSGIDDAQVERFAVLVLSAEDGAVVRELAPPAR